MEDQKYSRQTAGKRWWKEGIVVISVVAGAASLPALVILLYIASRWLCDRQSVPPILLPTPLWLGCWVGAILIDVLLYAGLRRLSPAFAKGFLVAAALIGLPVLLLMLAAVSGL